MIGYDQHIGRGKVVYKPQIMHKYSHPTDLFDNVVKGHYWMIKLVNHISRHSEGN